MLYAYPICVHHRIPREHVCTFSTLQLSSFAFFSIVLGRWRIWYVICFIQLDKSGFICPGKMAPGSAVSSVTNLWHVLDLYFYHDNVNSRMLWDSNVLTYFWPTSITQHRFPVVCFCLLLFLCLFLFLSHPNYEITQIHTVQGPAVQNPECNTDTVVPWEARRKHGTFMPDIEKAVRATRESKHTCPWCMQPCPLVITGGTWIHRAI